MVLQHLFPVFALVALGTLLKHFGLTGRAFLTTADRLIYYIFFPALLFWKISLADLNFSQEMQRFCAAALCAVAAIYVLSTLMIFLLKVPEFQAGAFSQSCYRFNTYIGMAVIMNALGETGVARFGLLIGILIPIINVLAVGTMIWFSGQRLGWRQRARMTALALISNPLILACLAGMIYARWMNSFPQFIENTFRLGASVTLPLALLSIGGSLKLTTLKQHFTMALAATGCKLLLLPVIGYALMRWFGVDNILMAVGMIFFTLPTSTAIYVLSAQLNSDTEFSSASIVLSTGLSFFSLSAVLWWLNG